MSDYIGFAWDNYLDGLCESMAREQMEYEAEDAICHMLWLDEIERLQNGIQ